MLSTFINSISKIVESYGGKVLKILVIVYYLFSKTSDINDINSFHEAIECDYKILDENDTTQSCRLVKDILHLRIIIFYIDYLF